MDEEGQAIDQRVLYHDDQEKIREYFSHIGQDGTVTLEATRNWYWLFELLEEEGLRVKLAHPSKVRLIAEARIKTDSIDASTLAHLERTGYLPEAYIPSRDVRDNRELLRYRLSLVRIRTSLKNRIHAILDKLGINHPFFDLFGKKGREFLRALSLRDVYRKELDGYLSTIEFLDEILKGITKRIQTSLEKDPQAELLMSIPGISYLTAHLLLCEIGDIQRFPSAKRLCSYAGIVPGTHQSADHIWHGPITKQGNCTSAGPWLKLFRRPLLKILYWPFFTKNSKGKKGRLKPEWQSLGSYW
jgi:transposase